MQRVLIIGIDGGTFRVLDPAMENGYMPCLARLKEAGSWGILQSTIPAITPAAWASFQTGMNPGRTGVYDFVGWDKTKKRPVTVSSLSIKNTIWEIVGSYGLKVGVINVPLTYPPKAVNGLMVSGILTPSIESSFTHPPEFREELLREIPDYPIFNSGTIEKDWSQTGFNEFIRKMAHVINLRSQAARLIMEKVLPHLFMVHFQASDIVQHALWADIDHEHPSHNPERQKHIFKGFYKHLDTKIAELIDFFQVHSKEPTAVMIVSDHGFQAHIKRFNLGCWLVREGFTFEHDRAYQPSRIVQLIKLLDVFNLRGPLFSGRARNRVGSFFHRLEGVDKLLDLSKSSVIGIGRSNEGFIFLLEKDKNKARKLKNTLVERLSCLKDPETGGRVIRRVHQKEDIFHGEFLDLMPDLVVEPEEGYSCTSYFEPGKHLFERVRPGEDFHSGRHHSEGIFLLKGYGVAPEPRGKASIMDIAPTLYYYLGLPVSRGLDGQVILEWFTEDFLAHHPVNYTEPAEEIRKASGSQDRAYSEAEEEQIRRRLRDLGYM